MSEKVTIPPEDAPKHKCPICGSGAMYDVVSGPNVGQVRCNFGHAQPAVDKRD